MNREDPRFNRNILGLRGLCALSVVALHHYDGPRDNGWFSNAGVVDFWITSLQSGVDLFFMISGFLMVPALLRADGVKIFATNRLIRIYPTYLATILPVLIVGPFVHFKHLAPGIASWLLFTVTNVLLLPGILTLPPANFIAWTLSYEVVFHVFVSVILVVHRRCGQVVAFPLCVLLAGLAVAAQPFLYAFATGALVWWLMENRHSLRLPAVFCPILLVIFMGLTEVAACQGNVCAGSPRGAGGRVGAHVQCGTRGQGRGQRPRGATALTTLRADNSPSTSIASRPWTPG